MPSRVVDDLWHEFILDTREYGVFCKLAFGDFFHHVPAAANPPGKEADAALRRTWRYACLAESIDPRRPNKLLLLFAIDTELTIVNGQSFINWLSAPPREKNSGDGFGGCSSGGSSSGGDSHGGGHSGGHGCGGHGCSGACGGH
jgi:hypothetical protein